MMHPSFLDNYQIVERPKAKRQGKKRSPSHYLTTRLSLSDRLTVEMLPSGCRLYRLKGEWRTPRGYGW